jgi:UPF0755 protein
MFRHGAQRSRRSFWLKAISFLLVLIAIGVIGGSFVARRWYENSLQAVSSSGEIVQITIPEGSTPRQIATLLEENGVIRSARTFEIYLRRENEVDNLKAGVFEFSTSWTVKEVVAVLVEGKEASELFTIGPGLRLDQISKRLSDAGFDQPSIDSALRADNYTDHPALVGKPEGASLEGYLYPESFKITPSSTPDEIVRQSLDELSEHLTPELLKGFAERGITVYEALILGSIIEKEVPGLSDRQQVAQVFYKRLAEDIPLGADATYLYASAVFGGEPFPDLDSPYNTRIYKGLPPGPISNVSKSALQAVASPSDTDYLFYVTGDDGTNHFSRTEAEHQRAIDQFCTIACAPGYIAE